MTMNLIHDPSARLDYVWNWTNWLQLGETITSHSITVTPEEEMTVLTSTLAGGKVTAWVAGGVRGRNYYLTCHVTTSATRQDDRRFVLSVQDR